MKPNELFSSALQRIQKEQTKKRKPRPDHVTSLPLESIKRAPAVFQPRSFHGGAAVDDQHVIVLTSAIKRQGPLEPLTVWWSGVSFYVIDGHHRLEAYKRFLDAYKRLEAHKRVGEAWGLTEGIPIDEFRGSLEEAIGRTLEGNSKAKLNMSLGDKLNGAWRQTCITELTKAQLAAVAQVSERTIANMRKVRDELEKPQPGGDDFESPPKLDRQGMADLSWRQAQILAKGGSGPALDWEARQDKLVKDWTARLLKEFGKKITQHPEAFVRALVGVNDDIPRLLSEAESWEGYAKGAEVDDDLR
ncbi:ParB N-terminal domain-containing protein [Oxalobacteraceae bacterium OTU3CAMAD1]|nr:ParB N-terminal domain-containing protein [Oxalobacteraceae bacterium OTU3CAMAD1]